MRETKRQQEERERIEVLQTWCKRLKGFVAWSFLPLFLAAILLMRALGSVHNWVFLLISLCLTVIAGTAVALNQKLPKKFRIRAIGIFSNNPALWGPVDIFIVTLFLDVISILACIRK